MVFSLFFEDKKGQKRQDFILLSMPVVYVFSFDGKNVVIVCFSCL